MLDLGEPFVVATAGRRDPILVHHEVPVGLLQRPQLDPAASSDHRGGKVDERQIDAACRATAYRLGRPTRQQYVPIRCSASGRR